MSQNYRDIVTQEPGKRGGRPCIRGLDQFGDGRGLVVGRLVFRNQLEALAAFGFLRPRRAMRHEAGHLGGAHPGCFGNVAIAHLAANRPPD